MTCRCHKITDLRQLSHSITAKNQKGFRQETRRPTSQPPQRSTYQVTPTIPPEDKQRDAEQVAVPTGDATRTGVGGSNPIDLLKSVDLKRDAERGEWVKTAGGIRNLP